MIAISVFLFTVFASYEIREHQVKNVVNSSMDQCMGVPIISEEMFCDMKKKFVETENMVCMEDVPLPYDSEQKCLYVSQDVTEDTAYIDLTGVLESNDSDYQLFFLKDVAFENLSESIKNGHKFILVAVNSKGDVVVYHLIFTTFPVVELHGECMRTDDRERDVYVGELNVWSSLENGITVPSVIKNRLEWKMRGNTAMVFPKKSYKISLKDKKGKKSNVSLLGMEKDDDYVLNPMWYDDLKLREVLAASLWNEIAEQKNSSLRMSNMKYCEVIINNKYQGLYLLQNRIERKTLKLDVNDMLFKGKNIDPTEDNTSDEVFEIVYSSKDTDSTYRAMDSFLNKSDFSNVDLENWVDLQLFLHLGNMNDNRRYKNLYYVIEEKEGNQILRFLPWDTDMSFGIAWSDGVSYLPESVEEIYNRVEYDEMLEQFPQLNNMLAERWKELRMDIFSEDHILEIIETYDQEVRKSGALDRDFSVVGQNAWGGRDIRENLEIYIRKRLDILDKEYEMKE